MRLIDADALKHNFEKLCNRFGEDFHISVIETEIAAARNVDAVQVRHGKWTDAWIRGIEHYRCTECGEYIEGVRLSNFYYNYCPNCGAKMDLEVTNDV